MYHEYMEFTENDYAGDKKDMTKKLKKADYIIIAVLAVLILLVVIIGMFSGKSGDKKASSGTNAGNSGTAFTKEVDYTDYQDKKIGIITGTSFEAPTLEFFPNAQHLYYNSYSDISAALKAGKIDGFLGDEPALRMMVKEQPEISYLPKKLVNDNYAFGFTKNNAKTEKIRDQFNEMLKEFYADGTMEELGKIWFGDDESKKVVDFSGLTGERLNVVTSGTDVPFSYYKDNKNVGLAIDLVVRFCHRYGYEPYIEDVDFAVRIPGLVSNKYDMCASSLTITPERQESIDFSDVIYEGGISLAVRSSDLGAQQGGSAENDNSYKKFDGKKLGIWTGTSFEKPTLELFPNSQYSYFDHDTDMLIALETGKIDGFIIDEPIARMACKENPDFSYYQEIIIEDNYCFGFPKDSDKATKLASQFNEMMGELWKNGEADKMITKWMDGPENLRTFDKSIGAGENGKIKVCVLSDNPPFSYYYNSELTGYAMELTYMFARRYGYSLDIEETSVTSGIAGISAGKYDFGAMSFSPTEERKKSMMFGDVFYKGGLVFMGRKADIEKGSDAADSNEPDYTEYDGKIVGILTGSSTEPITFEKFPNSKYEYYDSDSDLTLALKQKKIDAFVTDEPVARMIEIEQSDLTYLKKVLVDDDYHVGFQKDTESSKVYIAQFNEMLAELKSTGQLDKLIDKWFEGSESEKVIDTSGLDGKNGELKVAARSNKPPFSYFENSVFKGYAIELVTMFARRYGYTLKFEDTNLTSLLAGLSSKKYDIGISCLSITEERKKSIDFSDTFYEGGMTLVIRNEDLKNNDSSDSDAETVKTGFFESIKDSFVKNFVREDRWKLIVQGIGTTCLITLLTVIFGSILAFLICMLRRVDSVLAGGICNLYVKLLQGTPMVVLLMILYYVIFGKSGIDAIWVAVIGFSLNFGAYGSEIMRSGIESIDKGQREAALALGFTENQGFFKFIFPQAAVRFLPVYRGEIISLLKNTSIVGYIAIQDLTKMSDIIRSRTFEAFFPLISTAVIYFILAWIITFAMSKILKVVDPKNKKRA